MPTYEKAKAAVLRRVAKVMEDYHGELHEHQVTLDVLMVESWAVEIPNKETEMQTHMDPDHGKFAQEMAERWYQDLAAKAERVRSEGGSTITGGGDGEPVLQKWKSHGVDVRQRPEDEHGILRISIGGGDGLPVKCDYLVFRGDHGKCVDLLRKALVALESGPEELDDYPNRRTDRMASRE